MTIDVGRLYERAARLDGDDAPAQFACEVLVGFWLDRTFGLHLLNEQEFRIEDGVRFDDEVAGVYKALEAGGTLPAPDLSSARARFWAYCVLVRALDQARIELLEFWGKFTDRDNRPGLMSVTIAHGQDGISEEFYLIRRRPSWKRRRLKFGQSPMIDVVLQEHYILPKQIGDHRVEVVDRSADEVLAQLFDESGETAARVCGAVCKDRRIWPQEDGHYANFAPDAGIDFEGRLKETLEFISWAKTEKASILLMPELMTTRRIVEHVMVHLSEAGWQGPLVLPGTYHEVVNGKARNQAVLMGAFGEPVIVQNKMRPHVEPGFREQIDPGEEISVLLTPIGPICILICRDFCDGERPASDLLGFLRFKNILVPSMGDEPVSARHLNRADAVTAQNELRLLIVQQRFSLDSYNFLYGRCPGCPGERASPRTRRTFVKLWT